MKISTQNLKNNDSFRLRQLAEKNSLRGDDDRRRNTQMSIRLRNMRYSINNSSTNIGKCLKIKIKKLMKHKQRYPLIIEKICVRFTLFPVVLKTNSRRPTTILDLFRKFTCYCSKYKNLLSVYLSYNEMYKREDLIWTDGCLHRMRSILTTELHD